MDQLRNALRGALGVPAASEPKDEPKETAPQGTAALPDPMGSAWIARLRDLGGEIPSNPTLGQLVQRSAARVRALSDAGRKREAAELDRLRQDFERDREKRAWALVKDRFAALELPEKTYRALKQSDADPVKLLTRLTAKRSEELRGMGAARLREELG